MKSITSLFLFSFIALQFCWAQDHLKLKFTDGSTMNGMFKNKRGVLKDVKDKKTYTLDELQEITQYNGSDSIKYYVIDTKTYVDSKKSVRHMARLVYNGQKIKLYYVFFNWTSIHTNGVMSNKSYDEAFVQRTDEDYAYNMGWIYGAGYKGIKKRVEAYFTDCPKLVQVVNDNEIDKNNTLGIAEFYETRCFKK